MLTKKELKDNHNNVIIVMENHIMKLTGCDRITANAVAHEVLYIDRTSEKLLSNEKYPRRKNKNKY